MCATRVIVTRPELEAAHWVDQLQRRGFDAEALPLIEIAPASGLDAALALQTAWDSLADYAGCMFVSGNAVSQFFKQKRPPAHLIRAQEAIKNIAFDVLTDLPEHLRFMAPGPGTVAALRAAGVPDTQIDGPAADAQQFDSEALWRVVGQRDWQGLRVLIVRGQSVTAQGGSPEGASGAPGRDWIARQWTAAGAQVDFVCVYLRRPPLLSAAQVQLARDASADGSVWLLSSSEAVENLASLGAVDLGAARAVATHPRIARAARNAGWAVVVESRPQLDDISEAIASLGSIESGHP